MICLALSMTYDQFMAYSGKRAPSFSNSRLACDKTGKIVAALSVDLGLDHGAYDELEMTLPERTARFTYLPIPRSKCNGLSRVATTTKSMQWYGLQEEYGSPHA
jgi:aldehyde oxidoreductase